jgi:hypothetical protein
LFCFGPEVESCRQAVLHRDLVPSDNKKASMGTQKNVGVSDELLAAMDNAAKAQGKTADELFEEAGQRQLERIGLDSLIERGRTLRCRSSRQRHS